MTCSKSLAHYRYHALTLSIATALSAPAFASDDTDVENVKVWGTQVTSSSQFLGDEDIALKQADHLSDLLRDIPGVDVGGTHSINQRINIRGLTEKDIDITLDGASQEGQMFHHISNLTLNPDILKAVDIQVGASSVVNGGLGGSAAFETKDPRDLLRYDENFGARISAGFGSNDYTNGSLTLYGLLNDQVDAMAYISGFDRDNFEDGNGDETYGADGLVTNGTVKFGWEPNAGHRLEFTYDRYKDKGDYPARPDMGGLSSAITTRGEKVVTPVDFQRDTVTLGYEYDGGNAHKVNATLYYNNSELERDETNMPQPPSMNARKGVNVGENTNTGLRLNAQSNVDSEWANHSFTYGGEYNHQESDSTWGNVTPGDNPNHSEEADKYAVYIENAMTFGEIFTLTPGLRYDYMDRQTARNSGSYDDVTWALAAELSLGQYATLRASTRELFKAPTLNETFVTGALSTYDDGNLKAETGHNHQVGIQLQNDSSQAGYSLVASLTYFETEIENEIITKIDPNDRSKFTTTNAGDATYDGVEASILFAYQGLTSTMTYSTTDVEYSEGFDHYHPLYGRFAEQGDVFGASVDYQFETVDILMGWNAQFVSEQDGIYSGGIKDDYNVHNLHARWIPEQVDGLTLTFGIDNVFDEAYVSHASTVGKLGPNLIQDLEPGRNVKVTASYQF